MEDFKNIVGEAKTGEVSTIRFFGKITEESARQFNAEFDYLEGVVRPKLIRVLINSEGGSVLYGMSCYSTIQNSGVPTECIIEGMAASMASVIWAAGDKSLMRDYSILMIHNPFLPSNEEAGNSDMVMAFANQIKTIYRKRFGLKKDHVEAIMKGEAGKDGTFFDASGAVKAGIIPSENVLHTSKQLCEKVKNQIIRTDDVSEIQKLMSEISMEANLLETENKHFAAGSSNLLQNKQDNPMNEANKTSPELYAVAASLGFKDGYEVKDVMARISVLIAVEAKLSEAERNLKDAQLVIAGKDATISNLQKNYDDANEKLKTYQQQEAEAISKRNEKLVEDAVKDCKIDKESKAEWLTMAESNYALAEKTLNSIPAREQITKEIAADPANIKAAGEATQTVEKELAEKVTSVVGEKFEFKKLN